MRLAFLYKEDGSLTVWEGEMHAIPSGPESFVELPRAGGVALAAQESWIQNDTIRVGTASFLAIECSAFDLALL